MARKLIVLALVFVAIVGLTSAQSPSESPKAAPETKSAPTPDTTDAATPPPSTEATEATSTSTARTTAAADGPDDSIGAAEGPIGDDVIGAVEGPGGSDDDDIAAAAPLGGSESENAYVPTAAEDEAKSEASVMEMSAVAAVAAVAGFFL